MDLLERRLKAQEARDFDKEKRISKEIKKSVSRNRGAFLKRLLQLGDWGEIRKLRKGFSPKQGRLVNSAGNFVPRNGRAETLAEHLERVQWAVRPTTAVIDRPPIGDDLPIFTKDILEEELIRAAKHLRRNRAHGLNGIPAEFWKPVVLEGSSSFA